jgi:zinc protease
LPHIAFDRQTLANGLRVILSRDDRTPIVAVNLWYTVGSRHEQPGKTGFAHLFEHLMFQGSANVAKGEHFSLLQAAGGSVNATTSWDCTTYFETLPSHELELALWLESDRLAHLLPAMTAEKLANQRDVVKNDRRQDVDNQPYGSWEEKLQALVFPEAHPYHHSVYGSMHDLDAASLADVSDFFASYYAPNNATLTIAGDFDPPAALALVEKYFGPIPANPAIPQAPSVEIEATIGTEVREILPDRVSLPRLYAAYRIPAFGSAGFDALEVAADLLAGGRGSRLYRSLVREQRLAQEVSTFAHPVVGGASMLAVWATSQAGVEQEALEAALWAEVDNLAAEGPTELELERVRNLHAAGVESRLERVRERADRLSMYTCLFDQPERINTEVSRYVAIDAALIRDAIAATLRPDTRAVLTYLPARPAAQPRA